MREGGEQIRFDARISDQSSSAKTAVFPILAEAYHVSLEIRFSSSQCEMRKCSFQINMNNSDLILG